MITGVRLHRAVAGCAAIFVACATAFTARADAMNNVPPGKINSLVPSADEVGVFTGLPMHEVGPVVQVPVPPVPLSQRDDCRLLINNFTVDVFGSDFTAFRAQRWNYQPDPEQSQVGEAVATFRNAVGSQNARGIYSPVLFNTCMHAELPAPPGSDPGVLVEVFDFKLAGHVAAWDLATKYQGRYTGYNCFEQAMDLKNVMEISVACQYGNPDQTAARVADLVRDRVG
jgi:hypothetical protein